MRDLVVVGAGLAGLTAAIALSSIGMRVRVLEQADAFSETGAGITVSPNAARVFRHLGILDELTSMSTVVGTQGIVYCETGKVLATKDRAAGALRPGGAPYLQLLRPDLHDLLARTLHERAPGAVRLAARVLDVERHGDRVVATCADGSRVEGDALIGADGIRSRVRAALFGEAAPRFTGRVAWRGLIPVSALGGVTLPFPSGAAVGPGRTFAWYLVRRNTLVNYVAIVRTDEHREEGWRIPSTLAEVRRHFQDGIALPTALIDATDPASCFKWALCDRPVQRRWILGRVALLGDAAHPMLPFLGQGAAMGFEDAVVLARCMASTDDVPQAFATYERTRQPRAALVHTGSAARAHMWEARGVGQGLGRDLVDEERDLFPYDAATVPLDLAGAQA